LIVNCGSLIGVGSSPIEPSLDAEDELFRAGHLEAMSLSGQGSLCPDASILVKNRSLD